MTHGFLLQILKWEPDYFKKTSDLPKHMPKSLQDHIEEVAKHNSTMVSSKSYAVILADHQRTASCFIKVEGISDA
jgi:hypothetical protein